jgi:hypothetical protein
MEALRYTRLQISSKTSFVFLMAGAADINRELSILKAEMFGQLVAT